MLTNMSGGATAEALGRQFDDLVNDPQVSAIVLDVNSPGGQVGGIEELSKKIFDARGTKPIVAVSNHLMASAAYWIGTAADEIVVSPSSEVGSIGVFAAHQDISAALEKEGVKVSLIKAGKYKAEANPYEPLTEEARAAMQENVSDIYGTFVDAVARNRGVKSAIVRNGFGEGRVVSAKKAIELGMADRMGTLEEVIDQLLNTSTMPATAQANQIINQPQADLPREEVEVESVPNASEQAGTKPDPRKVQALRKHLYVQK
jgi:signal peptide peptidase SppA